MFKKWSEEDINFLKNNYSKMEIRDIATNLNRSFDGIAVKAQRLKLRKDYPWNNEKFKEYLKDNFGDEYILNSSFQNINDQIFLIHNKCGEVLDTTVSRFLRNHNRCYKCGKTRIRTNEEFLIKLNKKNPNILPLEEYLRSNIKILCKCLIDGHEWRTLPSTLLDGEGCPKCSPSYSLSEKEFLEKLYIKNPYVTLITKYTKMKKEIIVKCKIDEYEWKTTPSKLFGGYGCPRCGGVERYSTDAFIEKLNKINGGIEVLGQYVNHYTKIEVKCLDDGNIWMAAPHTLLNGIGCPTCNGSKGELFASNYFKSKDIKFKHQYSFENLKSPAGYPLRFDFVIFKDDTLSFLLEIDGIGHRKPIKFNGIKDENYIIRYDKIKFNDNLKDEYCKEHNIRLVRIEYGSKNFIEIEKILEMELSLS